MTNVLWLQKWPLAVIAAALFMLGPIACDEQEQVGPVENGVTQAPVGEEDVETDVQKLAANIPGVQTEEVGENVRQFIYYPTGQEEGSFLLIEKIAPAQVRVGQTYPYTIRVTNLAETPLAGVAVRERLPQGFEIDQATPEVQIIAPQAQQAQQPVMMGQLAQGQQPQQPQQPQQAQEGQLIHAVWQIGQLNPGETKTIQVNALAANTGQLETCITIDYRPTLCTMTNVINPQLVLVKQGPQLADICDPITYVYTVRNEGTGVAQNVRIVDPLPEGLATEDGNNQLEIAVGNLAAGQAKDFNVALVASQTGEFASRARAISDTDEAASQRVVTEVVQPNLAINVAAPEWEYIGQRITYRITVANEGRAPARQTVLQVDHPENLRFLPMPGLEGEAQQAARQGEFALGTIEPGGSKTLTLAYEGTEAGIAELQAVARAVCARAPEEVLVAQDAAQTRIAAIASLLIEVVDQNDPVQVGNNTVYTINVKNQGSGSDTNVRLRALLPEGLQFVEASGATQVQAEGNQLSFAPVPDLAPGDTATWQIVVRAMQPEHAQFRVQLLSDSLTEPVLEEEPTRLY